MPAITAHVHLLLKRTFLQQSSVLAQLLLWNQWPTGSQPFSLDLGKELWGQLLNFYFQTVWLTSIPQRLPWLRCQWRPLTHLWFGPIGHICAPVATSASVSWWSGQAVSQVREKTWRNICQLVCCRREETVPKDSKLSCPLSSLWIWESSAEPLVLRVWVSFTIIESDSIVESDWMELLLVSAKTSVPRMMGDKSLYFLQSGARPSLLDVLPCGRHGI